MGGGAVRGAGRGVIGGERGPQAEVYRVFIVPVRRCGEGGFAHFFRLGACLENFRRQAEEVDNVASFEGRRGVASGMLLHLHAGDAQIFRIELHYFALIARTVFGIAPALQQNPQKSTSFRGRKNRIQPWVGAETGAIAKARGLRAAPA